MDSTNAKWTAKVICFVGFLDLMAVSMVFPMVATRAKELGASPTVGGIIGSVYGATQLFSSPIMGSWSDARGRRFTLMFSLIATAVTYLLMGRVALVGLTVARLMAGVFKHSQSISQAFLANVISNPSEKSIYYGYFTATSNIGFIVGPTIGGHLAEISDGFFLVTLVASMVFLFNAAIVWKFLPEITVSQPGTEHASSKSSSSSSKELGRGSLTRVTDYLKNLELEKCWEVLVLRLVLAFSTLVYRSNSSLVLLERYELTNRHVGYLTSYQGVVSTISGFLVGHVSRLLPNQNHQIVGGVLTLFAALLGLTIASGMSTLVVSLTVLCISTSFLRVCLTDALVSSCPKERIGAVVGFGQSVTSAARMMSPLVGGFALEMGFYGPGIASTSIAGVGLVIAFYLLVHRQNIAKEKVS